MRLQDGNGQLGPPPRNNGTKSYIKFGQLCRVGPNPVIMTLQILNYTVYLNLFDNHLAHAFYPTYDLNLFIGHQAFKEDEKGLTCFALSKPVLAGVKITIILTGQKHLRPLGLSGTFMS